VRATRSHPAVQVATMCRCLLCWQGSGASSWVGQLRYPGWKSLFFGPLRCIVYVRYPPGTGFRPQGGEELSQSTFQGGINHAT
jgi:hypothetical protein